MASPSTSPLVLSLDIFHRLSSQSWALNTLPPTLLAIRQVLPSSTQSHFLVKSCAAFDLASCIGKLDPLVRHSKKNYTFSSKHLLQVTFIYVCMCVCGYLISICLLHSTFNYRTVKTVSVSFFLLYYITSWVQCWAHGRHIWIYCMNKVSVMTHQKESGP